jgi:hypothetical protein
MARVFKNKKGIPNRDPESIFSRVANRLSTLIGDVSRVWVDRDDRREILTLQVTGKDGTGHPARSLSDGTLCFLALSVLELDASTKGVLCLPEPENGIHPERIPAMLQLLQDTGIDPVEPVDETNPLRIEDFSPLRNLITFQRLEEDISMLKRNGWVLDVGDETE